MTRTGSRIRLFSPYQEGVVDKGGVDQGGEDAVQLVRPPALSPEISGLQECSMISWISRACAIAGILRQ